MKDTDFNLAKNIKKKIDINYNDIKLIRLAIKF